MKIIFKCEGCGLEWAKITEAANCEDKHKEVTWQEAIEAWVDGETIRMEKNGAKFEVSPTEFVSNKGIEFNRSDFERGKWFIEGGK